MKPFRKFFFHSVVRFPLFILAVVIGLTFLACESVEDPNEEEDDTEIASIMVNNDYGETLDIFMNGVFQFTLEHEESEDVDDVELDEHTLQARLAGTDQVVDEEEFDVTSYTVYTWTIDDPPDLNIINESGIDLMIYINDQYYFNLVDEEDRWVMNVEYGDYNVKAFKVSNEAEYASATITVDDNIDYSWTIY